MFGSGTPNTLERGTYPWDTEHFGPEVFQDGLQVSGLGVYPECLVLAAGEHSEGDTRGQQRPLHLVAQPARCLELYRFRAAASLCPSAMRWSQPKAQDDHKGQDRHSGQRLG